MKRQNHVKHSIMIFMNREIREKLLEAVQSGIVRELLELKEMIG